MPIRPRLANSCHGVTSIFRVRSFFSPEARSRSEKMELLIQVLAPVPAPNVNAARGAVAVHNETTPPVPLMDRSKAKAPA